MRGRLGKEHPGVIQTEGRQGNQRKLVLLRLSKLISFRDRSKTLNGNRP